MATIEPLKSVVTYKTQASEKPKPVTSVNTEVPEDGQTVNVDEVTVPVTRPQPEDDKGSSGDSSESQQQPAGENQVQQPGDSQAKTQQQSEQLKKVIAEMNKKINNSNAEAVFGVHEDTNRIMIKIMDKETKEVIKEFPPEKTLDMIARIWEVAGILVDKKL